MSLKPTSTCPKSQRSTSNRGKKYFGIWTIDSEKPSHTAIFRYDSIIQSICSSQQRMWVIDMLGTLPRVDFLEKVKIEHGDILDTLQLAPDCTIQSILVVTGARRCPFHLLQKNQRNFPLVRVIEEFALGCFLLVSRCQQKQTSSIFEVKNGNIILIQIG